MTAVRPVHPSRLVGLILIATIGSDQAAKALAGGSLKSRPPISFFGGIFQLIYVENPGGFLSLGAGLSEGSRFWLFTMIVGGFLIGLLGYLLFSRSLTRFDRIALSLVVGGGFSNLIDRVLHDHRVIDFMVIGIGWLRTGVFNIADVAITTGVGLLFWRSIRPPHRQELQTRSRHD